MSGSLFLTTNLPFKIGIQIGIGRLICCRYTIAAEQKARATYDNILRMSDDPDVSDVIKYLRAREIVHFQRFGEALDKIQQNLTEKNKFYMSK